MRYIIESTVALFENSSGRIFSFDVVFDLSIEWLINECDLNSFRYKKASNEEI